MWPLSIIKICKIDKIWEEYFYHIPNHPIAYSYDITMYQFMDKIYTFLKQNLFRGFPLQPVSDLNAKSAFLILFVWALDHKLSRDKSTFMFQTKKVPSALHIYSFLTNHPQILRTSVQKYLSQNYNENEINQRCAIEMWNLGLNGAFFTFRYMISFEENVF